MGAEAAGKRAKGERGSSEEAVEVKVVVIDDDAAILRSLEILLTAEGHRVQSFRDGGAAGSFVDRAGCPDVLILDYVIPPLRGEQVLRSLRPRLSAECRVILISGHTDQIEPATIAAMGVDAFLPKPLDFERLKDLVAAGEQT